MRLAARFAVNTLSNWTQRVVSITVGAVMMPYAVGHLGDTRYGIYGILGSVISMLALLDLGLSGTISRFSSRAQAVGDFRELRATATLGQLLMGGIGLLGGAAIVVSPPWLSSFFDIQERYYADFLGLTACMAAAFFLNFLTATPRGLIVGANRYDLVNAVEIVANVSRLGVLFVLFELFEPSLRAFGFTFVAYQCIRLVACGLIARFGIVRQPTFRLSEVSREVLTRFGTFGLGNALAVMGALALAQGPNFVVGRMLGPATVTALAPAVLVAGQIRAVVAGLCAPLLPLAGQEALTADSARLGEWSIRFSRLCCAMALAVLVPLTVLARPLLTLWMGPGFAWTAPVFAVMNLAELFASVQVANYYLILGGGRIVPYAVSEAVAAAGGLTAAVLSQWLFGWGLLGIAAGVATAVVIRNGIYLPVVVCRDFRISRRTYFREVYLRPAVPASIAAGATWALSRLVWPHSATVLLIQAALSLVLLGAGMWFLAMDGYDRGMVRDLVRSAAGRVRAGRSHGSGRTGPGARGASGPVASGKRDEPPDEPGVAG